ncbi:uridylate-specific endoribonuclease B isoform X2 [Nematostella vectensis]|uniref:uridylate-specific endoribonuclease B isoform X2 n=1 Tax=Nematostella vectensis TaxID=45351 RepID=UPI0020770C8E|nr:uridylate-specific endoribonuclease B isoform X2 [Nematostella vectensis]
MMTKALTLSSVIWSVMIVNLITTSHSSRSLDPEFCQRLFQADINRLYHGVDYNISLQNHTRPSMRDDVAPLPLFTWVNETRLKHTTFSSMEALFDNYFLYTGNKEHESKQEREEKKGFIEAVMATDVMKLTHNYLVHERLVPKSRGSFKKLLIKLWFNFYRRKTAGDTSGFEHVFVGEIKRSRRPQDVVGGMHNWVRFYREEKKKEADYEGFIVANTAEPRIVTARFKYHTVQKPIGGFFVGTSPEFELSLYTTCFLKYPNGKCTCQMNGKRVKIITYRDRRTSLVATAYPVV